MKTGLGIVVVVASLAVAQAARAWDGPTLWYEQAHGAVPGGGGIFGTGGARDHNITCEACHVERPTGVIDAALVFTPPLGDVAGMKVYSPGQTYQVRLDLVGELVGLSGCGPYGRNINNFAATFEADGQPAGLLMSDSGQSQDACPTNYDMSWAGTTALYRDCDVVLATDNDDGRTSWFFSWRAPAAGSGMVTVSYGVVDGDCSMMSMGDAVK